MCIKPNIAGWLVWLSTSRRSCAFSYILINIWILFLGPFKNRPSLVQMMALVLSKRKSVICTKDYIVFWRIHASFGLKGLKHCFVLEIPRETWLPSVYCIYKCPDVTMHLVIFLSKCEYYSWGPFDNKLSLVHMMAWHWTGIKPLPAPMTAQFSDAYMCHLAARD